MQNSTYSDSHVGEFISCLESLNLGAIENLTMGLRKLRDSRGRLFLIGIGGSAANASHAVNDFRKLTGIEAYCPSDNVSELTARANDEGWDSIFVEWLRISNLNSRDMLFVLSVGGGDKEKNVSIPIVEAIDFAKDCKATVACIVGRDNGYAAIKSDHAITLRVPDQKNLTPHAESMQSFVLHLLVSHPSLKSSKTKWEQVDQETRK